MAPPPPPELMEDAVGEILLRVPPEDSAQLLRAALVCKRWRRLLTDPAFLRRYRAFHPAPPLLGFLCTTNRFTGDFVPTTSFIPTASFRPRDPERGNCTLLDCRHGRVLLIDYTVRNFFVWDPITGEDRRIPNDFRTSSYNAAVVCAIADCDHLNCHGGPFLVVLVATVGRLGYNKFTRAWVYSSEAGEWSIPTTVKGAFFIESLPPVLARDKIYFFVESGEAMLRYDLRDERSFSLIDGGLDVDRPEMCKAVFLQAEHGGSSLRFAVLNDYKLNLWSFETVDPDGVAVWSQLGVIQLDKLLSVAHFTHTWNLIGFTTATDSDIVFVSTNVGVFTVELESHKIKKVYEKDCGHHHIFPYKSFFTPDCAAGRLSLPLQQLG